MHVFTVLQHSFWQWRIKSEMSFADPESAKVASLGLGVEHPWVGHADEQSVSGPQREHAALLLTAHVIVSSPPHACAARLHQHRRAGRGALRESLLMNVLNELHAAVRRTRTGTGVRLQALVVTETGFGVYVVQPRFLDKDSSVAVAEVWQMTLIGVPVEERGTNDSWKRHCQSNIRIYTEHRDF